MNVRIIFLIVCFTSVKGNLEDFPMPSFSTPVSRVIIDYMVNYLMEVSPVVNLFQVSDPNNTIEQHYIINEILWHTNRKNVVHRVILDVNVLESFKTRLSNRKRFNCIFFIDHCKSFDKIFSLIYFENWEYQGNYIVVITQYFEDIYNCMSKVFDAFWSKHIVNVVLMFMSHARNEVLIYTFYPFSAFYCERAHPIQLNQYRDNNFLKPIDYFPEKLSNLYGCPLSTVTFKNPPFMMYEQEETGAVHVDGIEGIVLRVLSQRLNFNVNLYISPDSWGYVHKNHTATGKTRKVNKIEVEI